MELIYFLGQARYIKPVEVRADSTDVRCTGGEHIHATLHLLLLLPLVLLLEKLLPLVHLSCWSSELEIFPGEEISAWRSQLQVSGSQMCPNIGVEGTGTTPRLD